MNFDLSIVDDRMLIMEPESGYTCDDYQIDPERPWDAVSYLTKWGHAYSIDVVEVLGYLRGHFQDCIGEEEKRVFDLDFDDDLMSVRDDDGNRYDGFVVDPQRPWDAVACLTKWGREYSLDLIETIWHLRATSRIAVNRITTPLARSGRQPSPPRTGEPPCPHLNQPNTNR